MPNPKSLCRAQDWKMTKHLVPAKKKKKKSNVGMTVVLSLQDEETDIFEKSRKLKSKRKNCNENVINPIIKISL